MSLPTKIGGQGVCVVFACYELQRVENDPQASQGLAHPPISRGQLIQGLSLEQLGMLCPV